MVNAGGMTVFNSECYIRWLVFDSVWEWLMCAVVQLLVLLTRHTKVCCLCASAVCIVVML